MGGEENWCCGVNIIQVKAKEGILPWLLNILMLLIYANKVYGTSYYLKVSNFSWNKQIKKCKTFPTSNMQQCIHSTQNIKKVFAEQLFTHN